MENETMVGESALEYFYLFRSARRADLSRLAQYARRVHYDRGALIVREGEQADALYLIEMGTVEVCKDAVVCMTLGSGGTFGEVGFFDPGPCAVSARAVEPCSLIRIPFDRLREALLNQPLLAAVFFQHACTFLARRLRGSWHDLTNPSHYRL
jgi:CRP-like cAMP-binding protein